MLKFKLKSIADIQIPCWAWSLKVLNGFCLKFLLGFRYFCGGSMFIMDLVWQWLLIIISTWISVL